MRETGASGSRQRTLARAVRIEGVGLFTAQPVTVRIRPAEPSTGVVFIRTDTDPPTRIVANIAHLAPAEHRTAIGIDRVRIETVEHCLAALAGLGIDNAVIEIDGPELPIGDGSCALFTEPIQRVGTVEISEPCRVLVVHEPVTVTDPETGAELRALPLDDPDAPSEYTYELDYGPGAPIPAHSASVALTPESFLRDLAFARTFSTAQEVSAARSMGLFTHLEPKDMLVIGPDGPIDNALHRPDEPARHKVIDMIGDLSLAGKTLRGRFIGTRSGHHLNHELARVLLGGA